MDKYQQLQEQEDKLAQSGVQRGTATFCAFIDQLAAAFGLSTGFPVTANSGCATNNEDN